MIIFFHIPKTGGTSLIKSCELPKNISYGRFFSCKQNSLESPSILGGHLPYGVHEFFKTTEWKYFTILRDPVERWISLFKHNTQSKRYINKTNLGIKYKEFKNLENLLDFCLKNDLGANMMVRQLSGYNTDPDLMKSKHRNIYVNPCVVTPLYSQETWKYLLKNAIKNLLNFDEIIFQDTWEIGAQKLVKKYLWNFKKKSRYRKSRKLKISEIERNKIIELNRYDIELYNVFKNKE